MPPKKSETGNEAPASTVVAKVVKKTGDVVSKFFGFSEKRVEEREM